MFLTVNISLRSNSPKLFFIAWLSINEVVEKLQQVPVAAWFFTAVAAFFLITVKFIFGAWAAGEKASAWANEKLTVITEINNSNTFFIILYFAYLIEQLKLPSAASSSCAAALLMINSNP